MREWLACWGQLLPYCKHDPICETWTLYGWPVWVEVMHYPEASGPAVWWDAGDGHPAIGTRRWHLRLWWRP